MHVHSCTQKSVHCHNMVSRHITSVVSYTTVGKQYLHSHTTQQSVEIHDNKQSLWEETITLQRQGRRDAVWMINNMEA